MLITQKLAMTLSQASPQRFVRYLGKDITFRDAMTFIDRYSYFLQNFVQHKKRVGVFMGHSPYIYYSFFGLANTLNQMIPLNPDWSNKELAETIDELGIDVILLEEVLQKRLNEIIALSKKKPTYLAVDNRRCGEYDKLYRLPVGMSASDKDVVLWLPSEGNSAKRKWIPYTHTMLEAQAMSLKFSYKMGAADTFFTYKLSPLHPFALLHGGIIPLVNGSSIYLSDHIIATELVPELMEGKATRLIINPKNAKEFTESIRDGNLKWPRLRSITPVKNSLDAPVRSLLHTLFKDVKILQHYGGIEIGYAASMVTMDNDSEELRLGASLPGVTLRILDAHGNEVKPGSGGVGEIVLSGKGLTTGYLKIEGEDQKFAFRGASHFTGDIGTQAKNGALLFLGKKAFAPQHQGNFVDTHEAEAKIRSIPGVTEVLYIGIENRMGKPTKILLLQRSNPDQVTPNDVLKFCKENLPEPVQPANLLVLAEFPYDEWGAVDRYRLAEQVSMAA